MFLTCKEYTGEKRIKISKKETENSLKAMYVYKAIDIMKTKKT